jgi:hypothetical protein
MNGSERYKTDADFRRALEQRLATAAHNGARGLVRERQVLVFERFLARAVSADLRVVIKGGLALGLRTQQARTTRDIDLRAMGSPDAFADAHVPELSNGAVPSSCICQLQGHVRSAADAP